jgi:NADH-quinone oxidoreductase subunit M
MNMNGVQGAVYQMLAHGISTGGLFLIVGMLSDRRHTRQISEFGGLRNVMPRLTAAFMIMTLASIGMPALNGFIGEFLTMLGAYLWDPRYVVGAGLGVILSAVYMLWMFQRVYLGEVTNPKNAGLPDLQPREWASVIPLCAMAILMGVAPTLFTAPMEPAVARVVERVKSVETVRADNRQVSPTPIADVLVSPKLRSSGGGAGTVPVPRETSSTMPATADAADRGASTFTR